MTIRVRTKIIISFVSVLVVLSFLAGITYLNRNLLFKSILHMEDEINTLDAFAGLQLSIDMVVMPANDYLINGDPIERERFRNIADEVEEGFKRLEGLERHKEHALLLQGAKERTRELNVVNERLKELSITDGLTGAYNHSRRLFIEVKKLFNLREL